MLFRSPHSLRIRETNRTNIQKAPAIHIAAITATVRPFVISDIGPTIAASGLDDVKYRPQSISINAPEGTTKFNAVTTQIQYFVVALAAQSDVSTQAAQPTIDAYNR